MTTITDPRNTQTTIAYDASNRAQTITTAGTRVASFAYGTGTTTFTDANNNATVYTINTTGQATQIRDALNGTTAFVYDANYNVTQTTDPLTRVTRATYDARGNVLTSINALNQTTTYTYNVTNDLLTTTDPLNRTTTCAYDAAGNLTSVTDALNQVSTYGYNAYGQRTSATDTLNRNTTYAYNSAGFLTSTTDAASGVTQYGYDSAGNRTSATDALNHTTGYVYDADDRLTQVNAPLNTTTRYEYDANGNRTATVDALNQRTTFTYDTFNRQTALTDALNHATQYQYDANGNRTRVTDANNNATNYQYDALNRLTRVTDALPSGNVTQYGYDAAGNRTSTTDARGSVTTSTYDALNRVTAATIPITGTTTGTTQYQYDAAGNRTRVTDANNNATNYQYDALNRVTRVTDAQGNATQSGYDAVSNRTSVTDATNQITTYAYDALNRVTTITNPSGKTQRTTYDAVSNRLTATDEISQTTRYTYDALNRTISVTDPLTQTTTYGYNAVSNITTITNPTGQVTTLSYDAVNRVTSKTMPMGTTQYSYDNVGNLLVLTDPSGATSTFTYNAVNWVTQQDDRATGGALVVTYAFAYDANGNKTSETETRPGKPARVTTYAYNKANWLVETRDPNNMPTTYAYDAAGNQTNMIDPTGYSTSVTPNALNQPQTTTHRNASGTVIATTNNSYNARGSLNGWTTTDAPNSLTLNTTLGYNANGYLSSVDLSHQGSGGSAVLTSTVALRNDNLVERVLYSGGTSENVLYDSAGRVHCANVGPVTFNVYDGSGRRSERYHIPNCESYYNLPLLYDHTVYTYTANLLTYEERRQCVIGNCGFVYARTLNYDGAGNVNQMVKIYSGSAITLTYTWEPGTNQLIGVSRRDTSGQKNYDATLDYDRLGRIRQLCEGTSCQNYGYVGESDWLAYVTNQYGTVLRRYQYANGRPLRQEREYAGTYPAYYYRYNWHGDMESQVDTAGNGGNYRNMYGAWGEWYGGGMDYGWNAAWGYLASPRAFNFDANDVLDIGLYYVHGRWYNQDTGLWLSPSESGEYRYGSGQDAINWAWANLRPISVGSRGNETSQTQSGSLGLQALQYKDAIKRESATFGVPWQVVGGVLESMLQIDTRLSTHLRRIAFQVNPGVADWMDDPALGIGSVHVATLKSTAKYFDLYTCGTCANLRLNIDEGESNSKLAVKMLNDDFTIQVMAAHVRQLADYRFGSDGHPWMGWKGWLAQWTLADAVAIWHGYRYGVPDVTPGGQGFGNIVDFQERRLGLDDFINQKITGRKGSPKESARQSIPYFQAYWVMPD